MPSPFVVHYDGCQMPSSREKINYDKRNPTPRRFRDERQYQPLSEGFRDQPRQQEYDMDRELFQPPPEKIQKINNDGDVRRGECHFRCSPCKIFGAKIYKKNNLHLAQIFVCGLYLYCPRSQQFLLWFWFHHTRLKTA